AIRPRVDSHAAAANGLGVGASSYTVKPCARHAWPSQYFVGLTHTHCRPPAESGTHSASGPQPPLSMVHGSSSPPAHASPTPSPSSSDWSGFERNGQLSQASPTPSPSSSACEGSLGIV